MKTLSAEDKQLLDTLQCAVEEALERKHRLGQYAVVWRDGQPAFIGPNPPYMGEPYTAAPRMTEAFREYMSAGTTSRQTEWRKAACTKI